MQDDDPRSTDSNPPASPARMIGGYRIVRKLGQGGMGVVYEAEQQHPRRLVALKVIRGGTQVDEQVVRLFQREAQALARLKHPGIAAIYDAGRTEDGEHFFAMELVRGLPVTDYLKSAGGASAAIEQRLRLFCKICEAVNYAHQRGVIHRDLKPSNILISRTTEPTASGTTTLPDVKILDFGLARITDADVAATTVLTEAGRIQGTLAYMSPEQARGNPDEIDLRSDVYSLGVILFEFLTGRLPYDVHNIGQYAALWAICEKPPELAGAAIETAHGKQKLDKDLQTILTKALEKEPARRYQSALALAEDVERYLGNQPILARPVSAIYQLRKLVARHTAGFAFAAGLIVLLAAFALTMALLSARIARERTRAEQEAAKATAIKSFLLETLGSANPVEGKGRDTTVLEALKLATGKIANAFPGQPEVEAEVRYNIGETYLRLGRYNEAEDLVRASLKMLEGALGPRNTRLIEPLNTLSILREEREDFEEAEALQRRSLALARKKFGEDSREFLDLLSNLALLLQHKGALVEAGSLMRQVLELDRKKLGDDDLNVAFDMNNLAHLLLSTGNYRESEPLLRRAERILRRNKHPYLFMTLGNLGEVATKKGDPAAAEPLFTEAVSAGLRAMGEQSQDVARVRAKYGACLIQLRKYPAAEEQLLAALPVLESGLGANNAATQRAVGLLVELYRAWGKTDKARAYQSRQQPIL